MGCGQMVIACFSLIRPQPDKTEILTSTKEIDYAYNIGKND